MSVALTTSVNATSANICPRTVPTSESPILFCPIFTRTNEQPPTRRYVFTTAALVHPVNSVWGADHQKL